MLHVLVAEAATQIRLTESIAGLSVDVLLATAVHEATPSRVLTNAKLSAEARACWDAALHGLAAHAAVHEDPGEASTHPPRGAVVVTVVTVGARVVAVLATYQQKRKERQARHVKLDMLLQ